MTEAELAEIDAGDGFDGLLRRNLVTGATADRAGVGASTRALPIPPGWIHDEWLGDRRAAVGRDRRRARAAHRTTASTAAIRSAPASSTWRAPARHACASRAASATTHPGSRGRVARRPARGARRRRCPRGASTSARAQARPRAGARRAFRRPGCGGSPPVLRRVADGAATAGTGSAPRTCCATWCSRA